MPFDRLEILKLHVVAPAGIRLAFFVNRQTFGEPSRDLVVRHLQGDDVREFMPERASPVELIRFARRWGIHHHELSKTDTQRSESRQSESAHGKVLMIGIHLKPDRTFRREFVFCRERLVGLLEQVGDVRFKRTAFLLVQLDAEMLG